MFLSSGRIQERHPKWPSRRLHCRTASDSGCFAEFPPTSLAVARLRRTSRCAHRARPPFCRAASVTPSLYRGLAVGKATTELESLVEQERIVWFTTKPRATDVVKAAEQWAMR